jgi:hypothetical protein
MPQRHGFRLTQHVCAQEIKLGHKIGEGDGGVIGTEVVQRSCAELLLR